MSATPEGMDLRDWRNFAGPVAKAYEFSKAPVAAITGPTGGGKSTASARRCLRVARWQHASPRDGVRRARIVCICPTYRRAWDTVIPSFFKVFAKGKGDFKGAQGDPANYIVDLPLVIDGQAAPIHLEVMFRAISEDMNIEDFFRGLEPTAFWLPEADTNTSLATILSLSGNRVGRYPEPDDRPENAPDAYKGVWCDANAPVIGTDYHQRFYLKQMPDKKSAPASDQHFIQPSGFSPNAENLMNLRKIARDFYEEQAIQLDVYDVNRLLKNKPGPSRAGKAVHENFDYERHVSARELACDRHSPVYISIDAGSNTLRPAAVFWQKAYSGQWRALAEIHPEFQMNTARFAEEVRAVLNRRFGDSLVSQVGGLLCLDPAAAGQNASSEYSTATELQTLTEIEAMLAPTNKAASRRSALDKLFLANVSGQDPAIVIDGVHCPNLIQALSGGFCYPKRGAVVGLTPEKNIWSHIAEAAEYGPLSVDGMDAREARFIRPGGEAAESAPMAIYAD